VVAEAERVGVVAVPERIMDDKEVLPKKIRVMADYGDAYAWDESGVGIGLDYNFEDHPSSDQIKAVESELEQWAAWFYQSLSNENDFPWNDFHETGLKLATDLSRLLEGSGIEATYESPFEDPTRGYHAGVSH
jgi:hypothetical protein